MKDFAGSRTTYYSLVRDKLTGKHPRMFNLLLVLILISMTGLAAFLISDILSFGFNSDHRNVLTGIELQGPLRSAVSAVNWNEKRMNLAVIDNPKAQEKGLNGILSANLSQNESNLRRIAANASRKDNNSIAQMENLSHKAEESNSFNSSRMAGSSSSGQASGYVTVRKAVSGTGSSKAVDQKTTSTAAATTTVIKHHSSSSTSTSKSQAKKDLVQSQKDTNNTTTNSTKINGAKINGTNVNATETNITNANSTSMDQLQKNIIPANMLAVNDTSINRSRIVQSSARESQSKEDRTIVDPLITETAKSGSGDENRHTETQDIQFMPETPLANTVESVSARPYSSIDQAVPAGQASLAMSGTDSRSSSARDTSATDPVLKIGSKADLTANSKSDEIPSGDHTVSGRVSSTKTPSDPGRAERSTARSSISKYRKNVASASKDPASISRSQDQARSSESSQESSSVTYVKTKTQQLQESRSQQVAKRNKIVEDAKKRTIRSR